MKALQYEGPNRKQLSEKSKPVISADHHAIVRMTKTTICGTDLHILKGDVPTVTQGRILGHEGVGTIDAVGSGVRNFKPGDQVLISCITADGTCEFCRKGMFSHCINGGWVLGHQIDGTQAEYVAIPFADTSLYHIPPGGDEDAFVMLSDVLPTGYECGVLNGQIQPGNTVAIVGAGPIGLSSLLTAQFYAPTQMIMIDIDDHRLNMAKQFGATTVINSRDPVEAVKKIMTLTKGKGVDTAIEAVGVPETFHLCEEIVAAGGTIANVGVHGKKVDLHLERLWSHNITIKTRLVDTITTPMLLDLVTAGKIDATQFITHHFKFNDIIEAYETFGKAADTMAIKMIISF